MNDTKPSVENKSVSESIENLKEDAKEVLSDKPTTRRKMLSGGALAAAVFGSEAYGQITAPISAGGGATAGAQNISAASGAADSALTSGFRRFPQPGACATMIGGPSNIHKLLDKATFGWSEAERDNVVAMGGYNAWLNQQLDPYNWQPHLDFLAELGDPMGQWGALDLALLEEGPGGPNICCHNDTMQHPECDQNFYFDIDRRWKRRRVLEACFDPAQLLQVMLDLWYDWFNVSSQMPVTGHRLAPMEKRHNIYPNALGDFRLLLDAVTKGPAMLYYLNGFENTAGSVNENFARELQELHTLGINEETGQPNCYDETTIDEVARVLTGWQVTGSSFHGGGTNCGVVYANPALHDSTEKTIVWPACPDMVTRTLFIPAGLDAQTELDMLIDFITNPDPNKLGTFTADFVVKRMCRWLYDYEPPQSMLTAAKNAYINNFGSSTQIAEIVRVILASSTIQCAGTLIKRPLQRIASMIRATGGTVTDPGQENFTNTIIGGYLQLESTVPGNFPSPDGKPHGKTEYLAVLPLMTAAAKLAFGGFPSASISSFISMVPSTSALDALNFVDDKLCEGFMTTTDRNAILAHFSAGFGAGDRDELVSLALASPSFERH